MNICIIGKVSPIQGGVSQLNFWLCYALAKQGHQVHLVTNANEIEDEFRITKGTIPSDMDGTPFADVKDNINVYYTDRFAKYSYIPYTNPFTTKLASKAIEVVKEHKCDLIFGHYFEPYGVAAYIASKATGVPFGLKHAGSDVGRLLKSPEHKPLYNEMFAAADFIFISNSTARRFLHNGVDYDKLVPLSPPTYPEFIYNPERSPLNLEQYLEHTADSLTKPIYAELREMFGIKNYNSDVGSIGIYGKVGEAKGSYDLINALGKLKKQGKSFNFLALTNGHRKNMLEFISKIKEAGIEENTIWLPFMPHWKVPEFINLCDAVCFLERDFAIPIHHPGVASEVMMCGKCLIVSDEIYNKQKSKDDLVNGEHLIVVDPHDTSAMMKNIQFVLENREAAKQIGRNCYKVSKDMFPPFDEIAVSIEGKFTSVLEDIKLRELEMSAIELQSFVNRLYTDDVFRKLNDVEPSAAEGFYKLSDEEKTVVRGIERKALAEFDSSLKKKSFNKQKTPYEYTCRAIGENKLAAIFDRYYNINPAYPGESKLAANDKFGQFIEDSLNTDDSVPNYATELVRFERKRTSMNFTANDTDDFTLINQKDDIKLVIELDTRLQMRGSAALMNYDYNVAAITESIDEDVVPESAEQVKTDLVLFSVPIEAKVKILTLTPAAAILLTMLEQPITFASLVEQFEDKTGIENCQDDLKQAVEYFNSNNLVLTVK